MKDLSIFVDESGDFGPYKNHSPYYIVTFVFHSRIIDISPYINHLNDKIRQAKLPETPIHTGPLIRNEAEYRNLSLLERKQIFNFLYNFTRAIDINYQSIIIEKKHLDEKLNLHIKLIKDLSVFFNNNIEKFLIYRRIIVYYDYGQMELGKIIESIFTTVLNNVEFKKAVPTNYKLFQAADMICTLELLSMKARNKMLSKSELLFFKTERMLYKSYLKAINIKRL